MAGTSDSRTSVTESEDQERQDLSELKRDLDGWREALLPLRSLLTWEKPYYPLILFGVTTLVFALIWSLEPSVVTTFAILGLVIITVDFAVPLVGPYLFSKVQWTGNEEHQFEEVCERILHFRTHLSDFVQGMIILKEERPKIYFFLVLGVLTIFAWIGYIMNNLFLTYILVLTILMIPGLRQKGFLQRYFLKYWLIFKRLLFGRMNVIKDKKN